MSDFGLGDFGMAAAQAEYDARRPPEPGAECSRCGAPISEVEADDNNGLCDVCATTPTCEWCNYELYGEERQRAENRAATGEWDLLCEQCYQQVLEDGR